MSEQHRGRQPHQAAADDQDRNFLIGHAPTLFLPAITWTRSVSCPTGGRRVTAGCRLRDTSRMDATEGLIDPAPSTFFGVPSVHDLDALDAQVAFLGVPYDGGTPQPGIP